MGVKPHPKGSQTSTWTNKGKNQNSKPTQTQRVDLKRHSGINAAALSGLCACYRCPESCHPSSVAAASVCVPQILSNFKSSRGAPAQLVARQTNILKSIHKQQLSQRLSQSLQPFLAVLLWRSNEGKTTPVADIIETLANFFKMRVVILSACVNPSLMPFCNRNVFR